MTVSRVLAVVAFLPLTLAAAPPEKPPANGETHEARPAEAVEILRQAEAAQKEKHWAQAAGLYQRFTEQNPCVGQAWTGLAQARYHLKDYRQAIPAFTRALELRAGYPWSSAYDIACCHALLGEKEEALRWLQKAMDLGFRSLPQVQKDEDLKSLHDDERFRKLAAVVDTSKMSRDEGWRYDLALLAREIKRLHYQPFRKVSREEFDARVRQLHERIPQLTDDQIGVGLRQLVRSIGDGHTSIGRPHDPTYKPAVAVEFYLFTEGLFITRARPSYQELVGAQVVRIAGRPIEEVFRALDTVVSQDNEMGLKWLGPMFLRYPRLLHGLGLIPERDAMPLTVRLASGTQKEVTLPADASEPQGAWASARVPGTVPLYLKKKQTPYWFEYLEDQKTVYFQYNAVQDFGRESIEQFCKRLFEFIDGHEVRRLVIDMRWNGGGNNFLNQPLTHGLIRCTKINQPGRLFVVVGRNTFSAAMCGAAHIERHTHATFVGEPTGSSPNFIGETIPLTLPYSKMRASISDLYWQNTVAMDYRTWIAPTIYTPPSFAAYRANRDPALEAILSLPEPR